MRVFLIIWIGQMISMFGSGLTSFALGVWIYQQTKQATPFAVTVFLANLPRLVLLPFTGVLADRLNRRLIMILADTGNALLTLAIVILFFSGQLQVWHIYVMVALGSVCGAFQEPAAGASTVMLVPKKDLGRANGLIQMGSALTNILTPFAAGFLVVVAGLGWVFFIDFVTFFFAVGALLLVAIPQPPVRPQDAGIRPDLWKDASFGWHYLAARPGLFGLLWYYAMVNFLLNWAAVLTVPMVLSRYPASTLGVIQGLSGAGMLIGGIAMSVWSGPKRRIPAVIGFISLALTGFLVAGVRPHPAFIGGGLFFLMLLLPLASGNSQVVFQSKVAPDVQGRVFSIRSMVSQSMMPLAYLTAGPLADRVFEPLMAAGGALAHTFLGSLLEVGAGRGIGLMFVLSGLLALVASALAYANPRIRNVEDELPDAVEG